MRSTKSTATTTTTTTKCAVQARSWQMPFSEPQNLFRNFGLRPTMSNFLSTVTNYRGDQHQFLLTECVDELFE